MKIYVGHSTDMNFEKELYEPLRHSDLDIEHDIVLPHEESDQLFDSKTFFEEEFDLFVAEVSRASTGLGIELGWADEFNVPILCVYRSGFDFSGSIQAVTGNIKEYETGEELISIIENYVSGD